MSPGLRPVGSEGAPSTTVLTLTALTIGQGRSRKLNANNVARGHRVDRFYMEGVIARVFVIER